MNRLVTQYEIIVNETLNLLKKMSRNYLYGMDDLGATAADFMTIIHSEQNI